MGFCGHPEVIIRTPQPFLKPDRGVQPRTARHRASVWSGRVPRRARTGPDSVPAERLFRAETNRSAGEWPARFMLLNPRGAHMQPDRPPDRPAPRIIPRIIDPRDTRRVPADVCARAPAGAHAPTQVHVHTHIRRYPYQNRSGTRVPRKQNLKNLNFGNFQNLNFQNLHPPYVPYGGPP